MAKKKQDKFKNALKDRLAVGSVKEDSETQGKDELVERVKKGMELMEEKEKKANRFKLTVRIPMEVREKLQIVKIRENVTIAELVESILEEWLENNPEKWKMGI